MTSTNPNPTDDPEPKPLFSVADLPTHAFPVEDTTEGRLYTLKESADQLVADGGCSSYEGTVKGLLGENAFANFLQMDLTPDTEVYSNGDGGFDFVYNGLKIDVKTVGRHRDEPALTVDAYGPLRADCYVLAHRIGQLHCRLVGYASRKTVEESPVHLHRGDPYYFVDRDRLRPFPYFLSS
jgi:hypothetical protein